MKIMRFELPNSPGRARVGFVDPSANQVVDARRVLAFGYVGPHCLN